MGLAIAGGIMMFFGLLISMTIIGAIIGVPMMIAGGIMIAVGMFGRRKTTITNIVQVSSAPGGQPLAANAVSLGMPGSPAVPTATPTNSTDNSSRNCGKCSTANETANKFCKNCGSELAFA